MGRKEIPEQTAYQSQLCAAGFIPTCDAAMMLGLRVPAAEWQ